MDSYSFSKATDNESAESLLDDNESAGLKECSFNKKKRFQDHCLSWIRDHRSSILFNIFFLFTNMTILLLYAQWIQANYTSHSRADRSPLQNVIKYEDRQWDLLPVYLVNGTLNPDKASKFNGKPTSELAEAWKNLVQHQNIRLQQEELGRFGKDDNLVELSDGSGYFATIAVFHGLHCVKRLHHYLHRDEYYPDMSEHMAHALLYHTEHCIDWLRQYVQCNADTTLIPFYWGAKQASPLAMDKAQHQCVSWEPLEEWMEEHSFDPYEPGLLVHPVYGDPYTKENKGDATGIALDDHVLASEHHHA